MEKSRSGEHATTINITDAKGKGVASRPPLMAAARGGYKRGLAIMDFVLRLFAIGAALAATITMGTTDQTLPFFTQFFQFQASYDDLPAFSYEYIICSLSFKAILRMFFFS